MNNEFDLKKILEPSRLFQILIQSISMFLIMFF